MTITTLLKPELILLDLKATDKTSVINELVSSLALHQYIEDESTFKEAIWNRETQSTTGIGEGIAIPHAKHHTVKQAVVVIGRSVKGIDYASLDSSPAHLFFMIAVPENANDEHLKILAQLSSSLMNESFRNQLMHATNTEEVLSLFASTSTEKLEVNPVSTKKKIIAVTACPTGIAHTFMAAEKLVKTAELLGVEIKVETNGAAGPDNVLTKKDIEEAVGVIIAADKAVEMDRFAGKRVLQVPVGDAIKRPEELIQKISKEEAPVYQSTGKAETNEHDEKTGFGSTLYKHLMNGVSHMLPLVVGGGILIAICFMFGIKAFDPKDPSYHPIAEALMTIGGGNAFALMVPILAGFIAMSIANKPGLAAGLVGGMIASSGGAGFLGGIVAGFLGGYSIIAIRYLLKWLPKWLEGIKNVLFLPVLGVGTTGLIMLFAVVEPASKLNKGLSHFLEGLTGSNAILLGLLLGAMMAIDMGGPINKAAYVFGVGLLTSNVTEPMAAVMAAGMTPPLGLALATFLFKSKFVEEERKTGLSTAAMGVSFITEGAIPFAARDPLRVIPSLVVGSAITGALSMYFKVKLQAPHGGIFTLFIPHAITHVWLYALTIVIGTVVTALMLGLLKKTVK